MAALMEERSMAEEGDQPPSKIMAKGEEGDGWGVGGVLVECCSVGGVMGSGAALAWTVSHARTQASKAAVGVRAWALKALAWPWPFAPKSG